MNKYRITFIKPYSSAPTDQQPASKEIDVIAGSFKPVPGTGYVTFFDEDGAAQFMYSCIDSIVQILE